MNSFGHNFRITIWGESHGEALGIAIDGLPAGIALRAEEFSDDLARRRSGAAGTTPRHEADTPQLLSGVYEGHTTGTPLTILFTNRDADSGDYPNPLHFRPSHADRTTHLKYNGYNDPRGAGHHSGRLTVALVAAGVVAKKLLPSVVFQTQLVSIGGCDDPEQFEELIHRTTQAHDSVGGVVECRAQGVPEGLGEPFFDSAESLISHLLFSIPAIKGVEFGDGFAAATRTGSQNNDLILDASGHTATNHEGGINGGITNGNELVFRAAVKPTPSIGRPQQTFNAATGRCEELTIRGRHDVCIALRAAVVVEAAAAIALADMTLTRR